MDKDLEKVKNLEVLTVAEDLFAYMRERDIEIPRAMGAFATALALMGAKLQLEQEDLFNAFKHTTGIVYEDYRQNKENNTH